MFNRSLFLLFGVVLSFSLCFSQAVPSPVRDPREVPDSIKGSVFSRSVAYSGNDSITITYHSPAVRKRIIWGGLVPYGDVWVTGAHNATTLETTRTLRMGDQELAPGKYALFTIPGPDQWTIIINKNWNQHLAWDYDVKDDLLRFSVKPEPAEHLERLQYFIEDQQADTIIFAMRWERVKLAWKASVKKE
ncbi:MAG: DUF2911 domain-containing protein [Sphingomonadales bacterium]|nr:DUF2911 domain-containing protein [Sphingomonadales bacterium]